MNQIALVISDIAGNVVDNVEWSTVRRLINTDKPINARRIMRPADGMMFSMHDTGVFRDAKAEIKSVTCGMARQA